MTSSDPLLDAAVELALALPPAQMEALIRAIEQEPAPLSPQARTRILQSVPLQPFHLAAVQFLDTWQRISPALASATVLLLLRTALRTARRVRKEVQVKLVWTGPETHSIPLRRTEEALLDVIHAARENLLIVSFAVYKAQAIMQALTAAQDRGVQVRICLEAPEPSDGRMGYDTLAALGAVGRRAQVYIWPRDKRPLGPHGKPGSLHAKIAVADADHLFISSANLTDYAMHLNMEMGVVIRGGPLPGRVRDHFLELIRSGVLVRADN